MIEPPGFDGVVFGDAADGDPRTDPLARSRFEELIGSGFAWSWANQVHGNTVLEVNAPGAAGDADGLLTNRSGLALAVATADCVPVVIEGQHTNAVVHAGWRGMAKGVVAAGMTAMSDGGDRPQRAAIGPSIGPCCYEIGLEVAEALAPFTDVTTWGTASVDLWAAAESQLEGLEVWRADLCTFTDHRFRSHRRDGTAERQVSVTWQPTG
jgi:hypothetical protein